MRLKPALGLRTTPTPTIDGHLDDCRIACLSGIITTATEPEMSTSPSKTPTIARIWRGRTTRERADEYEAYNYDAGIKPLIEKALGVQTFREDGKYETEFMTISYWESVEAMA